jgi:uncharacterized protein YlxP (DUF503 family)
MYVGLVKLSVAIPEAHSLKEKRMVIRRIKDRVRDKLGVVVNEVGEHEVWQRAMLGASVASSDRVKALELVDEVVRVVMTASGGQVVGIAKDAWTFDAPLDAAPEITDRTGSGDKAAADDNWIPPEWRED